MPRVRKEGGREGRRKDRRNVRPESASDDSRRGPVQSRPFGICRQWRSPSCYVLMLLSLEMSAGRPGGLFANYQGRTLLLARIA